MYIENMFAALPQTDEVLRAKRELLAMMEDKYNELKAEGRNENEAVGKVIAEFGNVDEVLDSLHIERNSGSNEERAGSCRITKSEAQRYISADKRRSLLTAIGTMLCILSPSSLIILIGLQAGVSGGHTHFPAFRMSLNTAIAAGLTLLFVLIAAAVIFFIAGDLKMREFGHYKTEKIILDTEALFFVKGLEKNNTAANSIIKTTAVILCVLSPLPLVISTCVYSGMAGTEWSYGIFTGLLLLIIAAAVFLLIYGESTAHACRQLLKNNCRTAEEKKSSISFNQKFAMVRSVYWSSLVIIYIITSVLTGRWGITWMIWPVGAIVWAITGSIWRPGNWFQENE